MKIATCVADINITCSIKYQHLYILMPIDEVECIKKTKHIKRLSMPLGSIVYAGWDKYKKGVPHRVTTKRNMLNSLNISMSLGDDRYASITIYGKKLHICGCKSEQEMKMLTKMLVSKLVRYNEILSMIRNSYAGIVDYINMTYGEIYRHNSNRIKELFGDCHILLDSYLSTILFKNDVLTFLDWIISVDMIIEKGRGLDNLNIIESCDIHNISADVNVGYYLDLSLVAKLYHSNGYDVQYSNIHDQYVHIVVPYDEIDHTTTTRKKSRFIFNVYRTGAIKIYGPSFQGIEQHTNNILNIMKQYVVPYKCP